MAMMMNPSAALPGAAAGTEDSKRDLTLTNNDEDMGVDLGKELNAHPDNEDGTVISRLQDEEGALIP